MKTINKVKKRLIKTFARIVLAAVVLLPFACDLSYDLPEANSKIDERPPVAFFGASARGDDQWNQVDFVNGSSGASSFVWDFGDGTATSTEFEPVHSYPPLDGPTNYDVKLTVTDANEKTDVYDGQVTITTNGIALTDFGLFYDLVNAGTDGAPVSVESYSSYQEDKDRFATNTLDANLGTYWTSMDGDLLDGDFKSDGEFIIYDMGSSVVLKVFQFTTDSKSDPYGYQVWTSNTGVADEDFSMVVPETGAIQRSIPASTDYQSHVFAETLDARYVKLVVFGRFKDSADERSSVWTSIGEVQFYKEKN